MITTVQCQTCQFQFNAAEANCPRCKMPNPFVDAFAGEVADEDKPTPPRPADDPETRWNTEYR